MHDPWCHEFNSLCSEFIICQLSFHASSIWGRITTRFCSCIPMVSNCAIYYYSNLRKQSSTVRFLFLIQSRLISFLHQSFLSVHYTFLLGLHNADIGYSQCCNSSCRSRMQLRERAWVYICSCRYFLVNLKIHCWGQWCEEWKVWKKYLYSIKYMWFYNVYILIVK